MPVLLLPAANDKLHWHLQWSNPTTQATTSGHLPKHRIRDVHAHLPRSRRSSSLGSQPNLVPEFLSCHAAATLVLVRPSPYLRSLWLEHELRHRTAPLHHYARSSIARYVTPDYVQYSAFLCRRVNARVAFQSVPHWTRFGATALRCSPSGKRRCASYSDEHETSAALHAPMKRCHQDLSW